MRRALFSLPLAGALLAALWTGCIQDGGNGSPPRKIPLLVPARIKSVVPGTTDTSVTLLRYDSRGILVREIRSASVREWDSLGRYTGVRVKDSARYLERVEWIGADSTTRTQPPEGILRDKFFGARANCWCADSIRHSIDQAYVATRLFTFDYRDNPLIVKLRWADSTVDYVQVFQNTYDAEGKLTEVYAQDNESGALVTTLRLYEYDTLKNVTVER